MVDVYVCAPRFIHSETAATRLIPIKRASKTDVLTILVVTAIFYYQLIIILTTSKILVVA